MKINIKSKYWFPKILLNYKCPKGTVDDTYSCGKTPEERKENYEKTHPGKELTNKKVTETKSTSATDNLKSAISEVKKEIKSGNVSDEQKAKLKTAINDAKETLTTKPEKSLSEGYVRNKKTGWPDDEENYSKDLPTRKALLDAAAPLKDNKDLIQILQDYAIEENIRAIQEVANGIRKDDKKTSNDVKILKNALNSVEIPQSMTVFRGIRSDEYFRLTGLGLDKPGTIFKNKSFMSTSVNKSVSALYTDDSNIRIEINIPKGLHAAYIDQITKGAYKGASDEDIGDEEILINKDTKFVSRGIKESNEGIVMTFDAMLDPSTPTKAVITTPKEVEDPNKFIMKALPKNAKLSDNGDISWENLSGHMYDQIEVINKVIEAVEQRGWKVKDYKPHYQGDDGQMHIANDFVSPDGSRVMHVERTWGEKGSSAKVRIKKL